MLRDTCACYLANAPCEPNHDLAVRDKFTDEIAARVPLADAATMERALAAAAEAAAPMRALPAHARQAALAHCADRCAERADELAHALTVEVGKPLRDSRGEVERLIETFRIAAEEAVRIDGEIPALDRSPRTTGYTALSRRFAVGPCGFITPFNFPLNLAAHKLAPAIAAGCPFVLRPARNTPLTALLLGEILAGADLPPGAFSILPCDHEVAAQLITDERLRLLSFTGSPAVGWTLKARAGRKRVLLELGGNAACIVDEGSDLDDVVPRLVTGGYYQSGQSCISVQRILAHESLYDDLRHRLTAAVAALVVGDPHHEATVIGPLISEAEAQRVERWIGAAVDGGARLLCGGERDGAMLTPAVLERVPRDADLWRREVFGPAAALAPFTDFEAALAEVNASEYGLQAGVFTNDLQRALHAWEVLEVGGVMVNEVPSWRADAMPYGGVKGSGLGREGVRYAIAEMTEPRLMVVRRG